jgi:outer membrane protein assembly factor BamE
MKRLALPTILLVIATFSASGCVYKMSIQQGNYLVTDSVSQLKEGMTRSQVRFLLGTPMVPDAFNDARWDYYYFFKSKQYPDPLKRRLTVYFEDERVQKIENQGVPTQTDLGQLNRDLEKALAATKNAGPKQSAWKRMFGKDQPPAESATTEPASGKSQTPLETEAAKPPDPVPASQPLPAPAGTPSGQP